MLSEHNLKLLRKSPKKVLTEINIFLNAIPEQIDTEEKAFHYIRSNQWQFLLILENIASNNDHDFVMSPPDSDIPPATDVTTPIAVSEQGPTESTQHEKSCAQREIFVQNREVGIRVRPIQAPAIDTDDTVTILSKNKGLSTNDEQSNPTFIMNILAHPITPIVGVILLLAGIAICAVGFFASYVPIICTKAVVVANCPENKFRFFSRMNDQTSQRGSEATIPPNYRILNTASQHFL